MPDVYRSPGQAPGSTDNGYAGWLRARNRCSTALLASSSTRSLMARANTCSSARTDNAQHSLDRAGGHQPRLVPDARPAAASRAYSPVQCPSHFVDGSVGLLPDAINCSTLPGLFVINDSQGDRSALLDFHRRKHLLPEPASLVLLGTGLLATVVRASGVGVQRHALHTSQPTFAFCPVAASWRVSCSS